MNLTGVLTPIRPRGGGAEVLTFASAGEISHFGFVPGFLDFAVTPRAGLCGFGQTGRSLLDFHASHEPGF